MCKELVQVVTLDKDDILIFDTGKLPPAQAELWLKKHGKFINYQHPNPCLMALREGQGLTIVKRPYVKELPYYTDDVWEENMKNSLNKMEDNRRKSIEYKQSLEIYTDKCILDEIDSLKGLLKHLTVDA